MANPTVSKRNEKKFLNFTLMIRCFALIIFTCSVLISFGFSINYLVNNNNEAKTSLEFSTNSMIKVKYDGVYNKKPEQVIKLLESRFDASYTGNIEYEKSNDDNNWFVIKFANNQKNKNINIIRQIDNITRRGSMHFIAYDDHSTKAYDLMMTDLTDIKTKTWKKKDKRLLVKDVFESISHKSNNITQKPEIVLKVKNLNFQKTLSDVVGAGYKIFAFSDIGVILNNLRNDWTKLGKLVEIIKNEKDNDRKNAYQALFANEMPIYSGNGDKVVNGWINNELALKSYYDNYKFGYAPFSWTYNDKEDSANKLSIDTNNPEAVFDLEQPFDATKKTGSVLYPWLPHLKNLILDKELTQFLKKPVVDEKYVDYFIGEVNPSSMFNKYDQTLRITDESFNKNKAQRISSLLQSGMEKHNFSLQYYILENDPILGNKALTYAFIAIIVMLTIVALILLTKYRLLGLIAVLTIIIFLSFTLVSFSFLNNIISPEVGIALLITFALLLENIVTLYHYFQKEYQDGKTIFNAYKIANRKTLPSAFDTNIIVLVISLVIFWFGVRAIKGFAIMTIISSFGVLLFGVLILRMFLYCFLQTKAFEKYYYFFALKPIKDTNNADLVLATKKQKFNSNFWKQEWSFWHNTTKWIVLAFSIIIVISGFSFIAFTNHYNYGSGFATTTMLEGKKDITVEVNAQKIQTFNLIENSTNLKNKIAKSLKIANLKYKNIYAAFTPGTLKQNEPMQINIIIETANLSPDAWEVYQNKLRKLDDTAEFSWNKSHYYELSGKFLFSKMIIAIAIALIVIFIYVIIRFQLTFTIPLIGGLVLGILTFLSFVSVLQVTISTMTIGAVLAIVILILINSVTIFDKIKELKSQQQNEITIDNAKAVIKVICNNTINKMWIKSLLLNSVLIITAILVIMFTPTLWSLCLSIIFAVIIAFVISYFVTPWIWTFIEHRKVKRSQIRKEKTAKIFVTFDEYIINGIND